MFWAMLNLTHVAALNFRVVNPNSLTKKIKNLTDFEWLTKLMMEGNLNLKITCYRCFAWEPLKKGFIIPMKKCLRPITNDYYASKFNELL